MPLSTRAKRFLKESNAIEDVFDEDSFHQAIYAWEYLIAQDELTTSVILKTHKILMLHQPLMPNEKGYWRTVPVFVGGREAKPYHAVPELMRQWTLNANDLTANYRTKDPSRFLSGLTKLHHINFEKVHPFVDGNGRIGRMLLNWQRIKLGLPILIIKNSEKQKYYEWFN